MARAIKSSTVILAAALPLLLGLVAHSQPALTTGSTIAVTTSTTATPATTTTTTSGGTTTTTTAAATTTTTSTPAPPTTPTPTRSPASSVLQAWVQDFVDDHNAPLVCNVCQTNATSSKYTYKLNCNADFTDVSVSYGCDSTCSSCSTTDPLVVGKGNNFTAPWWWASTYAYIEEGYTCDNYLSYTHYDDVVCNSSANVVATVHIPPYCYYVDGGIGALTCASSSSTSSVTFCTATTQTTCPDSSNINCRTVSGVNSPCFLGGSEYFTVKCSYDSAGLCIKLKYAASGAAVPSLLLLSFFTLLFSMLA